MSLIQEALKRKSEETPEQPEPMQAPAAPQPNSNAPQPLLIGLIVLLIIALLVALGGLAITLIKPATQTKPATEPPPQEIPVPQETLAPPVVPPPVIEEPVPVEAPVAEPVVVEQPIRAEWPVLKLTGIASSGNQRIAIINDKMLIAGRRIGDVIIREVRETDAVVEFHGERRTLHVDE